MHQEIKVQQNQEIKVQQNQEIKVQQNQEIKVQQKRYLTKGNDKYNKVTYRDKILLLKRVICDQQEIKETAQELNINYSTAKTIMRKFKKHGEEINHEVLEGISNWYEIYRQEKCRCEYKVVQLHKRRDKTDNTSDDKIEIEYLYTKPVIIYQQVLFKS